MPLPRVLESPDLVHRPAMYEMQQKRVVAATSKELSNNKRIELGSLTGHRGYVRISES
jgi:hypothetical protein